MTAALDECVAFVVPLTPLAPPLKVFVPVLLAVYDMSSVPILIVPDAGNEFELARTMLVVVVSVKAVASVEVAGLLTVPLYFPAPQPKPATCPEGPTL